jgi:hypothetical protein
MRMWKTLVIAGLSTLIFAAPAPAYFDDYEDSQSNPLRVVAYILHPVGYTAEWLIARPLHALVSQPELEPIFGHTPHEGWDTGEYAPSGSVPLGGPMATSPAPVVAGSAANPADLEAARRAADDARASAEEAKRAAEEAARAADNATRAFDKGLHK